MLKVFLIGFLCVALTHQASIGENQSNNNDDNQFAEECLKQHNYYRAKHGVNPLKLSEKVFN